ncbi:MAG TPA: SpoIIE family protein phosphatase [Candidatus Krumholzibacteria bacterium]|nr:SpoIIE family protein phosphatase [Candidatus Krumholzibacteria bacterium]
MTIPHPHEPRRRPSLYGDRAAPWARPLLFVFVIATVVLAFPGSRERFQSPYSGIQARNLVVQSVREDGPNAGADLRAGDELFAIDGERLRNGAHYQHVVAANRSFRPQSYEIRRHGVVLQVPIEYQPIPRMLAAERVVLIVLALAFLVGGLWVYFRRSDVVGTLFAFNSAILASFLTDGPSTGNPALQLSAEIVGDAIILAFPATLLHFFLRFPDRGPRESGARRRAWLYIPPAVIFAASAVVSARRFRFVTHEVEEQVVLALSTAYFVAYVLSSLVVFVRAYRAAPRAQKQKLRVVIAGTVAGLLPFLAATVHASIRPEAGAMSFTLPAELCLGFVPIAFAYAILKHGAIELTSVVRKSLVYALLTGLLIATYYALVQTAGAFLSREFGVSEAVWGTIAVVVLAIGFAPVRERVQGVVDRIFYRAEYVYKQEVIDFGRQVARTLTREEMFDHFIARCDELLHPTFVVVYLRGEDKDLGLERVHGAAPEMNPTFTADSFLGRYFTRYRTPLLVEFLDRSWERPNLDPEARRLLSLPGLAACVPIAAPDRLLGVALLGQKRSGTAYRRADAELLETFADQLALVVENADLIHSSIEKERLKSEVMLARDIQQALLPATAPRLRDVEIRGQMISSSEVGGDYFDYFMLDERRIVVAIGDVMGKGVPAAMLMASLQAVFKNRAAKGGLAPHELNRELNDYLVEHAKPGQFATFFCGVLDLAHSTFTFSSAGQCPALLATNGFIDRLGNGGTVLGANPNQDYAEGTVAFHPGDLLILYTDGVIEQMNDQGEPYGEQRLVEFVEANRNLPPDRLQNALLADVLAFGGGRQDDDITSVIAVRRSA